MGIAESPNIFQEKMLDVMNTLDYICMYLDDVPAITWGNCDDNLTKL